MVHPRDGGQGVVVVGGGGSGGNSETTATTTTTTDQDDYGPRILTAVWLVGALSGIVLALRLYCKVKRSRQAWYDDYVLMAAWLFQTTNAILITVNVVSLGEGKHIYNLDESVLPTLELNGNVSGMLSIIAATLSKTSFGITLLRLTTRYMKWFIWLLLVTMNIALGLSAVFIWIQTSPENMRFIMRYNLFSGVYSAVVDFVLAFLPWPLIWGLRMQRREKIGVAVAMSMGVFAGIGAIAKVLQLHSLASPDFTYNESGILIWGTVESAVTIIAVSVPFLRVLVVEARSPSAAPEGPFARPRKMVIDRIDEEDLGLDLEEYDGNENVEMRSTEELAPRR